MIIYKYFGWLHPTAFLLVVEFSSVNRHAGAKKKEMKMKMEGCVCVCVCVCVKIVVVVIVNNCRIWRRG